MINYFVPSYNYYIIYFGIFFGLFVAIFFLLTFFENKQHLKSPKPKRFPLVSIIIPAYNEEKTIAKTIKSVLALNYPRDKLDIIVIDDGSKDATAEIAMEFEKFGVRVFRKKNGGKASALNLGLKKAKGSLVAGLDADSFASRNALKNMIGYFENSEVMAVTPTLKVYKPSTVLQRLQGVEYLFGVFLRKVFSYLGSIHVTPGPFTVYRKRFFNKYGYYDEKNITEDIEVALRIQSKNYAIENSIHSEVFTVAPTSLRGLLKQRIRWYTGFMENVYNYRGLFNTKHGNLAIFILPSALLSVALFLWALYFFAYNIFIFANKLFLKLVAINFDLSVIKPSFLQVYNFFLYYLLHPVILLSILSATLGLSILLASRFHSKDKSEFKLSYAFYFLLYGIMFASWWTLTLLLKMFNIKVGWK